MGRKIKWTKEAIAAEAKRHPTRSAWLAASASSYQTAHRTGKEFFLECTAHMPGRRGRPSRWNKENLLVEAKKYSTRTEWAKSNQQSVFMAKQLDVYEICCAHMPLLSGGPVSHWTEEAISEEAKKYSTRTEWHAKSQWSLIVARRLGIHESCCAHMAASRYGMWTDEALAIEAKKYTYKRQWYETHPGSYLTATRRGKEFLASICGHMEVRWERRWGTEDSIRQEAKKYRLKTHWSKGSRGSFLAARRRGREFFESCCAHMEFSGRGRKPGDRTERQATQEAVQLMASAVLAAFGP